MLEGAFTFRGRIGRLQYFLDGLLALVGGVVAAVVLAVLVVPSRRDTVGLAVFLGCFGLVALGMMWFGLSLHVRRIRDIGWNPVAVIGGWLVGSVADAVLAGFVPSLTAGGHHHGTIIGGVANLALSLALFFWPGHDGPEALPPPRRSPEPRVAYAAPPASAPSTGARKEFGRRGTA